MNGPADKEEPGLPTGPRAWFIHNAKYTESPRQQAHSEKPVGKRHYFFFYTFRSTQVEKLMKSRFLLKAPYLAGAVNKQIRPFE
jgi:hypothetical protein